MYLVSILMVLTAVAGSLGQDRKCDQTPPQATVLEPIKDQSPFQLKISNAENNRFIAQQTYVLTLEASDPADGRPFTWFMITAEDPGVDEFVYDFGRRKVDVGTLKMLDSSKSRYSEKCANTVESFANIPNNKVEVHWVSPNSKKVRIRAMVAENSETWYTGKNLTIILERDKSRPKDDPPYKARTTCPLCSEARYEVIFKGRWSRLEHPLHYPKKPDDNGYSYMIGASHDYNYTIWRPGVKASSGMSALARESDITELQRDIISNMSETGGTRTLIRGKRRHHPDMHKWSHALFRVDNIHHLFTIVVAMRPSPDWFLGTKMFELCTDNGWLEYYNLPLYPWDAGVMDGVSYESEATVTNPEGNIERVEVGSFNAESPFYQTNLNDLKPFAFLEVRRLDVYPLDPRECSTDDETKNSDNEEEEEVAEEEPQDEPQSDPIVAESRQNAGCAPSGQWSEWSPCVPDVGGCGIGSQTRTWVSGFSYDSDNEDDIQALPLAGSCQANEDPHPMEIKHCIVEC